MNEKENPSELLVFCAVIVGLSILGIVGGLLRPLVGTLDGLLMLAICLMIAVIFVLLLVVLAKEQGWFGKHGSNGSASPPAGGGK